MCITFDFPENGLPISSIAKRCAARWQNYRNGLCKNGAAYRSRVARAHSWDDLRVFVVVARTLSFRKAATALRTSTSTVSRRVERLEDDSRVSAVRPAA